MAAVLDRLAGLPYAGVLVRADRAGVQAILQAAYDAIDTEAKTEVDTLGGKTDVETTPPPDAAAPAPNSEAAK